VAAAASLKGDDELCHRLSGGMYNTCYGRYLRCGGKAGIFRNPYFEFVKAQSFMAETIRPLANAESADPIRILAWVKRIEHIESAGLRSSIAPMVYLAKLGLFRALPVELNERIFYEDVMRFYDRKVKELESNIGVFGVFFNRENSDDVRIFRLVEPIVPGCSIPNEVLRFWRKPYGFAGNAVIDQRGRISIIQSDGGIESDVHARWESMIRDTVAKHVLIVANGA